MKNINKHLVLIMYIVLISLAMMTCNIGNNGNHRFYGTWKIPEDVLNSPEMSPTTIISLTISNKKIILEYNTASGNKEEIFIESWKKVPINDASIKNFISASYEINGRSKEGFDIKVWLYLSKDGKNILIYNGINRYGFVKQ